MNDYTAVHINYSPQNEDAADLLAAFLADAGYESFESRPEGLLAYIQASLFDADAVNEILNDFPIELQNLSVDFEHIEGKDWNEEWEKNYFKPIVISDRCVIHSTFHTEVPEAEYDIVIDPKMAFGTGHHATTSMMVRHLLATDLNGKIVIDMGTGTGILAILSMMRGASEAYGVEIDPAACKNAQENVGLNNCRVTLLEGDSSRLSEIPKSDLFIANINRNVILADIGRYVNAMKPGSEMLLSGFYEADIPMLERAASLYGLQLMDKLVEDGGWSSIRLHLKG